MRNWLRRTGTVLGATAAIALMGCGSDAPLAPENGNGGNTGGGITGTYSLTTVNGGTLPVVLFQNSTDKVEITAGSISLNADNSTTFSLTIRETSGGSVSTETETDVGTYSVTGNQVNFDYNSFTFAAVVSGSTLSFAITIDGNPGTLVFQK